MNTLLSRAGGTVKNALVLVGTVVGAGFVSGAELVRFFPTSNFVPCAYLAAVLLFLGFFLLFRLGAAHGGFDGVLRAVFGRGAAAVRWFVLLSSLVICACMLAGLDSVMAEGFGVSKKLPVLSAALVLALFFLSAKGLKGIGAVNLCLVPVILCFVVYLGCQDMSAGYAFSPAGDPFAAFANILLYVGMNVFLAAPVVCDLGARGAGAGAAGLASCAIGFAVAVILANIYTAGANAILADMPLLSALGGGSAARIFAVVSAFGIVTTLFSSWYPLGAKAEETPKPRLVRAIVLGAAFLLSRMGLKNIVDRFYPFLGLAGVIFLLVCAVMPALQRLRGRKGGRAKAAMKRTPCPAVKKRASAKERSAPCLHPRKNRKVSGDA